MRTAPACLEGAIRVRIGVGGREGWSWYTGSAGWYLRAVLEGLFGLRMESGRLSLPELPEGWELSIDTEI